MQLLSRVEKLQELMAQELSCNDCQLKANEVSVRVMVVPREGRLAHVEIDITAAPYGERIQRKVHICLNVAVFLQNQLGTDVKVQLIFAEIGHS